MLKIVDILLEVGDDYEDDYEDEYEDDYDEDEDEDFTYLLNEDWYHAAPKELSEENSPIHLGTEKQALDRAQFLYDELEIEPPFLLYKGKLKSGLSIYPKLLSDDDAQWHASSILKEYDVIVYENDFEGNVRNSFTNYSLITYRQNYIVDSKEVFDFSKLKH